MGLATGPSYRQGVAGMSGLFFQTYQDFHFFRRVTSDRRYFRSEQTDRFLSAVLDSCSSRIWTIEMGFPLYRAQVGNAWQTGGLGENVAYPFPAERMKPLDDRAHEGRVNPKGIPCLYLATSRDLAMSEVRPAPPANISVGRFETVLPLRVIRCTEKHGNLVGLFEPEEGKTDETVWATIDKAFGEPVLRAEDRADYAPTQIIAEMMRINGYDGIAYRSQFDSDGFNVALFDLNSAQLTQCHVYTNTAVQYKFSGPWNGYSD
jgi:RES domain-containing protein